MCVHVCGCELYGLVLQDLWSCDFSGLVLQDLRFEDTERVSHRDALGQKNCVVERQNTDV